MAITMVRFALKPIDLVKKKTDEQTMHETRTPRRSNQAEVVLEQDVLKSRGRIFKGKVLIWIYEREVLYSVVLNVVLSIVLQY